MIEQTGVALEFLVFYTESKIGKTGLTVTVDVLRNGTQIVTGGSASEIAGGIYKYELASGSNTAEGSYICIFKTATSTVDQQHIPALWVVNKAGVENLTADLNTILTDTNELQADWVNGGRLDLLIDAIKAVTDQFTAAHAEPTGAPAANESPLDKLGYIYAALRNKLTVNASVKTFFDDAGASLWTKTLSDDGTTYTETEGA